MIRNVMIIIINDHEDDEDVNHCSIGWIKSPEDTESFKLSINAPSAKVIIVVILFYVNLNMIF